MYSFGRVWPLSTVCSYAALSPRKYRQPCISRVQLPAWDTPADTALLVFETGAFSRSATSPDTRGIVPGLAAVVNFPVEFAFNVIEENRRAASRIRGSHAQDCRGGRSRMSGNGRAVGVGGGLTRPEDGRLAT